MTSKGHAVEARTNLPEQAALADAIESQAWMDIYDAAPPALRSTLGIEHAQVGDTRVLLAPGYEMALFNRAIGLGLGNSPASADDVARLVDIFTAARARSWWLHVNPHARPAGLEASLLAAGWQLAPLASWAKMLRPAGAVYAGRTALRVARAADADVGSVVEAITQGFGLPATFAIWMRALHGRRGWTLYGAFEGEVAVGGGALYVDGTRAWLGMGSMLASHRRLGGQSTLMRMRMNDATDAGVHWMATETGETSEAPNPSLLNMRRCGFHQVSSRRNLRAPVA